MRKSGLTGDEAYILSKRRKTAEDLGPLKKEIGLLKEDLSNKITKFYASNQGETHLADSDNGKIMDMMLYGKSEQKQYSGKNLLELSDNQVQSENLKIQINQGIITFSGTVNTEAFVREIDSFTVPSDGTYTISTNSNSNKDSPRILFLINDNPQYGSAFNGVAKELNAGDVVRLYIRISSVGSYDGVTIKPMIEKGSEVTSYEPYTGGQPSPSPDYPQEIKSVVNPVIKICGKNLFDSKKFPIILNKAIDTNTGKVYESLSGNYCAIEKYIHFPYSGKKVSFNASMTLCAYDKDYKFINTVNRNNGQVPIGTMYVRFDIKTVEKDKAQIELSENATTYEPYKEQTIQLTIILNSIPVSSGGNVTINGQQYVADYVDVERGKIAKMVDSSKLDNAQSIVNKTEWLLAEPQEIDLTQEEVQTLKALATYYPTTNISVISEQLDGYTVFNYPISMANGWNYVKQQLNDNRDYIYDMDTQSAEAYVNSAYAVALTELEV